MTLAEVGDKVCTKRQYIQQLEGGLKGPSQELLDALGCALRFKPGFFCKSLRLRVQSAECHFRKQKSFLKSLEERVAAHASIFVNVLDFLDDKLKLPPFTIKPRRASTLAQVEEIAGSCRADLDLSPNAPIKNMARVLEASGVPIANFSGISEKVDAFSWSHGRPIVVRSTDKQSWSRSRFDLAHEYGHLVMHGDTTPGSELSELEAHRFAGAFLFPREAFIREFPKSDRLSWSHLFEMKGRWGVSVKAIIFRAHNLGILDAARYRWANIYMNRQGWHKGEPHEQQMEEPTLIGRAFQALHRIYKLTPSQVALQLDLEPDILEAATGIPVPRLTVAS